MRHNDAVAMLGVIGLAVFVFLIWLSLTAQTYREALTRASYVGAGVAVLNVVVGHSAEALIFSVLKFLSILLWASAIYGLKRLVLSFRKAPPTQGEKLT
ncbi:hypothetical protein [Hyphomicrobium sp. MC8b]|uniref:hypothetical protein n=1 Tax=Hyphomicrobium sp. MC8b TaxID=300273 RepID=UPI00391CFAD5